ncbi:FecR family protein [Sphingopyxis sp.]|uniref:FecR family protein n=1 Tax=Sphingopyxis sp. TaxID=1908224 RepID=UPI00261A7A9D|nr:FecR domain-containing protein [Sphingopyxis sp.]MCW0197375.1 FecR domain-containing protein [Sphingopyxis sp.]
MRLLRAERPPQRPEDAAIWWATRRQLDPARFAEDADFLAWLKDEENARAWNEIDRRIDRVGAYATMPEVRAMRQAALDKVQQARRPALGRWFLGAAIAASLVLAFTGIAGRVDSPVAPTDIAKVESVHRYATAIGERRDVMLPDGSRVSLNTASLVEVDYGAPERREIRLLQGQAMFHVAHNENRPFIVRAGNRQVTALGTAFDVRLDANGQVKVLLVEGRVRVDPVARAGLARILPNLARTDLSPGQQLVAPAAGEAVVSSGDVERDTAWNRGILIFRDDSVSDAVREVNRYSTVQLVVDDPRVGALKVSGVFPTADRKDFLAAIEALYPVESKPESAGTVRLLWRAGAEPN